MTGSKIVLNDDKDTSSAQIAADYKLACDNVLLSRERTPTSRRYIDCENGSSLVVIMEMINRSNE